MEEGHLVDCDDNLWGMFRVEKLEVGILALGDAPGAGRVGINQGRFEVVVILQ